MCGDFNARLGHLNDVLDCIDGLPSRSVLDTQKNSYSFIECLQDAKLCMLNGRINPELNNYTSISGRGKAVVDYMLVPHDCIDNCKYFGVQTVNDLVEKYNLHGLISERCKPPDHSILSLNFTTCMNMSYKCNCTHEGTVNRDTEDHVYELYYPRRYRFDVVPEMYMASDTWKSTVSNLVDMFISLQGCQEEIDMAYSQLCKLLTTEMGNYLKYSDASKTTRKKYKNKKPFWNDHSSSLWKEMNMKEKSFLKCNGSRRDREQ